MMKQHCCSVVDRRCFVLFVVVVFIALSTNVNGWCPCPNRRRRLPLLALTPKSENVVVAEQQQAIQSPLLGTIVPIGIESDDDESFLSAMQVPTFAAHWDKEPPQDDNDDNDNKACFIAQPIQDTTMAGLEGVLGHGPAMMVHNVLSTDTCNHLIEIGEKLGFGSYQAGKNFHGALQLVVSPTVVDTLSQVLGRHINVQQVHDRRVEMTTATENDNDNDNDDDSRLVFAGMNRRWRMYRYEPGTQETFAPHIDAGFPPSGLTDDGTKLVWDDNDDDDDDDNEVVSRLTVLMYLNDDFVGGETNFYRPVAANDDYDFGSVASNSNNNNNNNNNNNKNLPPKLIASVRPRTGSVLIFPQAVGEQAVEYARRHWPLHEGSPVERGNRPKYVIRSDLLFATQKDTPAPPNDPLFRHDGVVRQTFLPQSPAMNPIFLQHIASLYNPHMGVENIGPLLYALVRFTKVRRVVEIGAGYSSLWILQALHDNNEEMESIRQIQRRGQCRLLDIDWTVPDLVDRYDDEPALLWCIDNCLHQKETATGATAVAKTLGLDKYMEFLQGDAYELSLEPNSVDLLWCDFGVGSRMAEFAPAAWKSVRPGGFLVCHSTLTNQGTRDWLEALRAGDSNVTGIPADEYSELSLLEPHKRFQNSISWIQKRKDYKEPIYSQFA